VPGHIFGSPARLGVTREASHREVPAIELLLGQDGRVASCLPPWDKPLAGRPGGSGAARRASSGVPVVQGPGELERLQVIGRLTRASAPLVGRDGRPGAGTAGTSSDSRRRGFTPHINMEERLSSG
jgi:hypothetical protein